MKPRSLVIWNSKEDCIKWHKERGTMEQNFHKSVCTSMTYGNYLARDYVDSIKDKYNIRVI